MLLKNWIKSFNIRQKITFYFSIVLIFLFAFAAITLQFTTSKRLQSNINEYTSHQLLILNKFIDEVQSETEDKTVISSVDKKKLDNILSEKVFGETGYAFLLDKNGKILCNPIGDESDEELLKLIQHININKDTKNFKLKLKEFGHKQKFYFAFLYNEGLNAYVVTKIPHKEIFHDINKNKWAMAIAVVLFIIISNIAIYRIMNKMIKRIEEIDDKLYLMKNGELAEQIKIVHDDELGKIGNSFNGLIEGLNKSAVFAQELGSGNYDATFELRGKEDKLGTALLNMRDGLKEAKVKEAERNLEESKRRWITEGLAKFANILRLNNNDFKTLSYEIISNVVNYLNVNQGGLFLVNDDEEGNEFLQLQASVAYNRKKFVDKEIMLGEGLVGTCAIEKKTIYLKEIPENYMHIKSGLGDANPKELLIVPLKLEDEVYGVIELASFNDFETHHIDFIEQVGESIASTLSNVKTNIKTAQLLERSQQQAEEMAAQEEEMRQNMEELQATQEELERKNRAQEEAQFELHQEKALLDSLLGTIPDYIYFKDRQSKFLKVSNSMLGLFGARSEDEVIGKTDFDYNDREQAQKYFDDEQEIMQSGKGIMNQLQHEVKNDGTELYTRVTKLPMLTPDGECIGTFGISKDITDIKLMELETERQKSLFDSLLSELPDYVYFKDVDSNFLRVSNSMLALFGVETEKDVIGKSDFDFQTKEEAERYLAEDQKIIEERKGFTNQIKHEVGADGNEQWNSVTKLPLINRENECIGTFGISKDVTEVKLLELEAKEQMNLLLKNEEEMSETFEELSSEIDKTKTINTQLGGKLKALYAKIGVAELDVDGVVIENSSMFEMIYNLDKKAIQGKALSEVFETVRKDKFSEIWAQFNNEKIYSNTIQLKIGKKTQEFTEHLVPVYDDLEVLYKIIYLIY